MGVIAKYKFNSDTDVLPIFSDTSFVYEYNDEVGIDGTITRTITANSSISVNPFFIPILLNP